LQKRTAQANTLPARKIGGDLRAILNERNAAKASPFAALELYVQGFQGGHGLWHHAFAARFLDRRRRTVSEDDGKTFLPRGDGRCQTGRTTADNAYVGILT
jgi:hypothetical protein